MSISAKIIAAVEEAKANVDVDAGSFDKLAGRPGTNTYLDYMYRDANNFKQNERAVFRGEITPDQVKAALANLEAGTDFIPGQVGMSDLQEQMPSDWSEEDDGPWHEVETIGLTASEPTQPQAIAEFASDFAKAKWDGEYRPDFAPPAP